MTRSRLRNKFLRTKSQEYKQAYNKQRNLCVTMVRKAKKYYFNNLNVRNITDNKVLEYRETFFLQQGWRQ